MFKLYKSSNNKTMLAEKQGSDEDMKDHFY